MLEKSRKLQYNHFASSLNQRGMRLFFLPIFSRMKEYKKGAGDCFITCAQKRCAVSFLPALLDPCSIRTNGLAVYSGIYRHRTIGIEVILLAVDLLPAASEHLTGVFV